MPDISRRKPMPPGYLDTPQMANVYGHSRTRTTSSNIFPPGYQHLQQQQHQPQQMFPQNMQANAYTSRRTPSTNTFSTTASSGNGPVPQRQSSQEMRISTSSRSSTQPPTSYVALMRRQKATVWCDRAQHEDPRMLAAQRQAKMRATKEVVGGLGAPRLSTSGSGSLASSSNRVTAKIRHHGKSGLVGYSPGDLVGGVGGVPMRLSASEVEEGEDSDDDGDSGIGGKYHQRSGSGRSSIGSGRSGRRGITYRQSGASSQWSSGKTPPGEERRVSGGGYTDVTTTPISGAQQQKNYMSGDGTRSIASGSSGERADSVASLGKGDAARLASNSLLKSTVSREKSVRNPDELRRRGSVDERTMTMSAGRLYIANPDTDSD